LIIQNQGIVPAIFLDPPTLSLMVSLRGENDNTCNVGRMFLVEMGVQRTDIFYTIYQLAEDFLHRGG
jgi:hypothetical protein